MSDRVCIVYHDMLTVYGHGVARCVEALFDKRTAFAPVDRFQITAETPAVAACFPKDLFPGKGEKLAQEATAFLLKQIPENMQTPDPVFFWALTQGEISQLENPQKMWTAQVLVQETARQFGCHKNSRIFSGSCASGNIALARGAAAIRSGLLDQVTVIGCDVVSEFTYAGFSSVHAITPEVCRPYDISHDGLLLGDAVGVMVLVSERKAMENHWPVLAVIEGYGITTDSCHAAAPDPEGRQMALAMETALKGSSGTPAGVIGHGTGTVLNDDMEIAALNRVFPNGLPLASIKGGTGHILAASGIIQTSCAVSCLERNQMFPQTSLECPQKGAEKFVSASAQELAGDTILTLNAGFGGLNAVIGVRRY